MNDSFDLKFIIPLYSQAIIKEVPSADFLILRNTGIWLRETRAIYNSKYQYSAPLELTNGMEYGILL